jgi:hypothetical protein
VTRGDPFLPKKVKKCQTFQSFHKTKENKVQRQSEYYSTYTYQQDSRKAIWCNCSDRRRGIPQNNHNMCLAAIQIYFEDGKIEKTLNKHTCNSQKVPNQIHKEVILDITEEVST